ncbi:MAG: hypothetical protein HOB82_00915 [Alphaproteobacteria bacterium]|jgi:hypothetical protein|nr:hypothetical protein [Alphaproteobacteria bacterium]
MKKSAQRTNFVGLAMGFAGLLFAGMTGSVQAAPMTGPEFDKTMILSEAGDGPGYSVGQFAGCANDRIQALVAAGERPRSTPDVSGEMTGEGFLVTVPGETTDILFQFITLDGHPGALLLDVISIAGAKATSFNDKVNAISVLVPNCI